MTIVEGKAKMSVQEFYNGKSVFITGGSGFLGKILIEKLLRSCPGIKNIYILMREKRNKSVEERTRNITEIRLFDELRKQNSSALRKIIPIKGNTNELQLGINETDRQILIDEVNIIFHVAASIRFNDILKSAILTNTRSTREVIFLAKQLKRIDVFVHVSTAYSNSDFMEVEEKLYPAKCDWRKAIEVAEKSNDNTMEILCQKYIRPLPNAYTFTKGLAEHIVNDLCTGTIPAVVIRPSIVYPTFSEPVVGWVDNFNGPMGIGIAVTKGIMRVLMADNKKKQDYVYADNVVKAMILSSWKQGAEKNIGKMGIYNAASESLGSPALGAKAAEYYSDINPFQKLMWIPRVTVTKCIYYHYLLTILCQIFPALLVDLAMVISGKRFRLLPISRKIYTLNLSIKRFAISYWSFKTDNYVGLEENLSEADKKHFSFVSNRTHSDEEFFEKSGELFTCLREYLLKEPKITPEKYIKRYNRWKIVDKILRALVYGLILYMVFWKFDIIGVSFRRIYNYVDNL